MTDDSSHPPGAPTTPRAGESDGAARTARHAAAPAAAPPSGAGFHAPTAPPAHTGAAPTAPRVPAGPPRPKRSPMRAALPALVALAVNLLMQAVIANAVPADAYVYRLFRPAGGWIMSVVPALIVFVLVWTLADLFLKFRVGRTNDRDLQRPEVDQLPNIVGREPMEVTQQRLRGWDQRLMARPVGRRVVWLLNHLGAGADPQRMHELLRHQSDLDADAAVSGYRTVKLFIWAMPILGFVGTVLGISLSVGGFSDFLTTSVSIDEIDRVTAELGEVASGLSFAFDTTLLGLLAGLIANVVSSGVQEREERLLTGLDELGLRIMESASPHDGPAPQAPAGPTEELLQVYARLEELGAQMHHFSGAMRSGLEALNEASGRMSSGLSASIGSVSATVRELGSSLEDVSQALARSVGGLAERVMSSDAHVHTAVAGLQEAIEQSQQRSVEAVARMEEAQRQLAAALAATAERVSGASDRLQAGVQSQAAAEQAMHQLSASINELAERLAEFSHAQDALAPALQRLSGPLELRLAPAPGDRGGT